jgi:hypothetical protein
MPGSQPHKSPRSKKTQAKQELALDFPGFLEQYAQLCGLCFTSSKRELETPLDGPMPVWVPNYDGVWTEVSSRTVLVLARAAAPYSLSPDENRKDGSNKPQTFTTSDIWVGLEDAVDIFLLAGVHATEISMGEAIKVSEIYIHRNTYVPD